LPSVASILDHQINSALLDWIIHSAEMDLKTRFAIGFGQWRSNEVNQRQHTEFRRWQTAARMADIPFTIVNKVVAPNGSIFESDEMELSN
jgi:hypothetical protein